MKLGVCYYPEHWSREWWADDAARMADIGLSHVRIGEFAWSRLEPEPGRFDWGWLDEAVETLHAAGLKVVMGTPTATPPKWLIDAHPDILAWDRNGRPRGFGSRRHYCFSSETYRAESARIVEAMAARYGRHPAVSAWQTDNEFGCHDTTLSYSPNAAKRFRTWLAQRYQSVEALNRAWGVVFWSEEFRSFDEVDPPNLTVTEPNPSHRLDYARFASDEVAGFNRSQAEIIRRLSPGRDITHNFMAFHSSFDHWTLGRDLDLASWDSYPLGNLQESWFRDDEKLRYLRHGHPDVQAFNHDLYRGVGRGRWWVMEQQPGPVNWARFNPAPIDGMVRAWSWEAFAHGAEAVTYFRWRQAPFAQEQMHAGLNRPDRVEDTGGREARQVAAELTAVGELGPCGRAAAALVLDYEAQWHLAIQPQGQGFHWAPLAFELYAALRRLGLDIDIVSPDADLAGYRLIVCPSLPILSEATLARLDAAEGLVLAGPRTGSRTRDGHIPPDLPPGPLQARLPMQVTRVESLRPGGGPTVTIGGQAYASRLWRERIETGADVLATFDDGGPAWVRSGRWNYLAAWPEPALADAVIGRLAADAGLPTTALEDGVRLRTRDGVAFAINYAGEPRRAPAPAGARFLLGGPELPPAGVAAWRLG
jgi:beta-galactosidase